MLVLKYLKPISTNSVDAVRLFTCSAVRALDQQWREKQRLPKNPNACGPLTHWPDYSFLDGRPTPLGSNQKKRLMRQQEIAAKIVDYNKELKFAKERHAHIQNRKAKQQEFAKQDRLKPKGHLLLKKSSD